MTSPVLERPPRHSHRARAVRTTEPWARVARIVAAAAVILVATTLSSLDRPVTHIAIAALVAGVAVFGLAALARVVLGPDGSLAAPLAAALLSVLGVVTAERLMPGQGLGQAVAAGLGAMVFLGIGVLTRRQVAWPPWAPAAATVLGCGLLVLPWLPGIGVTVGEARLGVRFGPLSGNPVELARPLLAALLAVRIAEAGPLLRRSRRWLRLTLGVMAPLAVASLLLLAAGDLGPLLILGLTTMVLLLMVRPAPPIVAAIVAAPLAGGLMAAALSSVVRERMAQMLAPAGPGGLTNIGAGLRAFGRGGWFGTGVGQGNPHAVRFAESDFVLTAIGEERGVIAVVLVIALFSIIIRSLWSSTAWACGDRARLVVAAMTLLISIQAIYTTAGVLGIVPLTGMAVPFVSLGGSALIGLWATLAVGVGLGAVRADPVRPATVDRSSRAAVMGRRGSTVALLATGVVAASVVIHPPVPVGSTTAPDWALRRGQIVAADGTPLAVTVRGGGKWTRGYPAGARYADVVGFTRPGAGTGLELTERERLSCDPTWWQQLLGRSCAPPTLVSTLVPAVQTAAVDGLAGTGVTGDAVVIDVRSGAVLAAYSTGAPDPTEATGPKGIAYLAARAADRRTAGGPAFATYQTSPGSVFKLIVGAAALEAGVPTATPQRTSYLAPDGTRPVRNAGGAAGGGSLEDALVSSSNTAFAEIATRVGERRIAAEVDRLTAVPGGSITAPATAGTGPLDPDALARTGFGQQGVRATPLTLAMLGAEIAGGGLRRDPHYVASVCDGGYRADVLSPPVRVLPEAVATRLSGAMRRVVAENHVPALRAIPGGAAAKTGTAERSDGLFDGLIVAYAPVDQPRVAVAVRVEADPTTQTSRSGGGDAGPVVASVLHAALTATDRTAPPENACGTAHPR
ncbi:MAG: FtsW/RodA/SpoVE family cell cycle protein [Pseudonocardiaceae bacterium]